LYITSNQSGFTQCFKGDMMKNDYLRKMMRLYA